ncbi:MAG: acyltransferase [Bacteroidota bacterium]|nr:acyltransferase [Ferruginibacter sp.]
MKKLFSNLSGTDLLITEPVNKNNFDLLRFFLAALVIYSHGFVLYYGTNIDTEPLRIFTNNQYDFGGVAVSLFFVISGFLIVRSFVHSNSVYEYLLKRVLRIVPGFVVAFLLSFIIAGYLSTVDASHPYGDVSFYFSRINFKRLLLQVITFDAPRGAALFVNNPIPNRVNSPLWTIQYEVICYLLVLLFGLVQLKKKPVLSVVFFLASFSVLVLQELSYIPIENDMHRPFMLYAAEMPRLMAAFFAGTSIYFFRKIVPRSKYIALFFIAAFVVASLWVMKFVIVLPLAGAYLTFYVAYHPALRVHSFAKRGDFSYGLYLYGWPVQQLLIHFFRKDIGVYGLFLLALPLAFLAAWLSWRYIESPFLKKKKDIHNLVARLRGRPEGIVAETANLPATSNTGEQL